MAIKIPKGIAQEIGLPFTKLFIKKAKSRLLGKMLTNSKEWKEAFEHISEHFRPIPGKEAHSIFLPQFASEGGVKDLISRALNSMGRPPVLTRDGNKFKGYIGTPSIMWEKEFSFPIGTSDTGEPCKILRIFFDITGRPRSAFPTNSFLGAPSVKGAGAGGGKATAVILGTTFVLTSDKVEAATVKVVQDVYEDEIRTHYLRYELIMKQRGAGPNFLMELVCPTPLQAGALDPSEIMPMHYVQKRAYDAVTRIQNLLRIELDDKTKENIKQDVLDIWGWWRFN